MKEKLIISAAVAGGATLKENNPNVPYTPEEFADECEKCLQEGVSIVHIHAKDPDTGYATMDPVRIRETVAAVRERSPELIINLSTGAMNTPPEDRINPVKDVLPELASYNTNSMNFALARHKTGEILMEFIYDNTFAMMADFAKKMKDWGVKPECEIFDPGGLYNCILIRRQGDMFEEPMHFQFVYGVAGGMPFDPQVHLGLINLLPKDATFSVCGVAPNQYWGALIASITGGHIRVGLEDNIQMPNGELAKGSWEQATWVKQIAHIAGRPIATPDEAREILHLSKPA